MDVLYLKLRYCVILGCCKVGGRRTEVGGRRKSAIVNHHSLIVNRHWSLVTGHWSLVKEVGGRKSAIVNRQLEVG